MILSKEEIDFLLGRSSNETKPKTTSLDISKLSRYISKDINNPKFPSHSCCLISTDIIPYDKLELVKESLQVDDIPHDIIKSYIPQKTKTAIDPTTIVQFLYHVSKSIHSYNSTVSINKSQSIVFLTFSIQERTPPNTPLKPEYNIFISIPTDIAIEIMNSIE